MRISDWSSDVCSSDLSIVVAVMKDAGAIANVETARQAIADIEFAPQPRQNNVRYFTDWVLSELEMLTDETVEPLVVKNGRASCRERVCQYVEISVGAVSLKKKKKQ